MTDHGQNKVIDESRQGEALHTEHPQHGHGKKLYVESYGCQMNFSDSEVVASIMTNEGYSTTLNIGQSFIIQYFSTITLTINRSI